MIKDIIIKSLKSVFAFTILTGIVYPLFVTGFGQLIFPFKSNGSLIKKDGVVIGSELIAQQFESNKYFQPRPSYNGYSSMPSGGSNLAIASKEYKLKSDSLCNAFKQRNNLHNNTEVPSEMMSYSASGIDPHISKQSAILQTDRISAARNFDESKRRSLLNLIELFAEKQQIGILCEERINVLLINLEIDKL